MPPASMGGKQALGLFDLGVISTPGCSCHFGQSSGGTSALRQKTDFAQGLPREERINWGQVFQPKQVVSCTIGQQTMAVPREAVQISNAVSRLGGRAEMTRLVTCLIHSLWEVA